MTIHTRILAYVETVPPEAVREFIVPGTPDVLTRPRIVRRGAHSGLSDHPNKPKKSGILAMYRAQNPGRQPIQGPAALTVEAVWSAPRAPDRGTLKSDGADIDNVIKLYSDALNGWAWTDDSQVAAVCGAKRYTTKGERPHVRVRIVSLAGFEP